MKATVLINPLQNNTSLEIYTASFTWRRTDKMEPDRSRRNSICNVQPGRSYTVYKIDDMFDGINKDTIRTLLYKMKEIFKQY